MTKRTTVKNDKLVFTKIAPKAHIDAQNRIRLTDEAIEIIEKIYMDTNISLTQIASEMIKYAADHVTIKQQPVVNEVLKK